MLMEGAAGALKLSSALAPSGPPLPAADTVHSATWEVFAEHLLNARHGARLWGHSCEGDKTPASWDSLSVEEMEKQPHCRGESPALCPPRLRLRDSSKEARLVLKSEGDARVRSGKRQGKGFR